MGIKGLYKVLNEHCPEQLVKLHLSKLEGCSLAIDISIFLYKFIRSAGEIHWMSSFIHLLCILKRYKIKAVCIFDGPNPPPEKLKEQEVRRSQLQKYTTRLKECIRILDILQTDYCPTARIPDPNLQKECQLLVNPRKNKRDRTNYEDAGDAAQSLILTIQRLEKQVIPITKEHKKQAKKIVKMMGLACFQADGEAETLCAYLACKGEVDAVLTEDTDVLAYGTPVMICFKKMSIGGNFVYATSHKGIIDSLELTPEEFKDLCILLRCDYNKHEENTEGGKSILGFPPVENPKTDRKAVSIGPVRAYDMIKEWGRLEEVSKYLINSELLKYRRCRELFSLPSEVPEMDVPFNKPLDEVGLHNLISKYGLSISMEYIKSCWKPLEVTIDYGSD